MSNLEACLSGLLYIFWLWRIGSFLYSSYWVSDTVTPSCVGYRGKFVVAASLMASTLLLHSLPLGEYPRLSLANRILSIPSQINSMYFMHGYVAPILDSTRTTVCLSLVTLASIIETLYMIHTDWHKID